MSDRIAQLLGKLLDNPRLVLELDSFIDHRTQESDESSKQAGSSKSLTRSAFSTPKAETVQKKTSSFLKKHAAVLNSMVGKGKKKEVNNLPECDSQSLDNDSKSEKSCKNDTFYRNIILLTNENNVPTTKDELDLIEKEGRARHYIQFRRSSDEFEISYKIKRLFKTNLTWDSEIAYYLCVGGKSLQKFTPEDGTVMSGEILFQTTNKNVYIKAVDVPGVGSPEPDFNQPEIDMEVDPVPYVPSTPSLCTSVASVPVNPKSTVENSDSDSDSVIVVPVRKRPRSFPRTEIEEPAFFASKEDLLHYLKSQRRGCKVFKSPRQIAVKSLIDLISSDNFSALVELKVEYINEEGVGHGPTKNLLSLLLQHLQNQTDLFEGELFDKTFAHNKPAVRKQRFKLLGRVMLLNLVNDGPAPQFFSKSLYHLICQGEIETLGNIEDSIPIASVRRAIEKVKSANDAFTCNACIASCLSVFQEAGANTKVTRENFEEEKREIISDVLSHFLYDRVQAPLQQFLEGLQEDGVNLHNFIKKYPHIFNEYFCWQNVIFTADMFVGLFTVPEALTAEETVAYDFFKDFLSDCEAGAVTVTLQHLFAFVTGLSNYPLLGLSSLNLSLKFSDEPVVAIVCLNELQVPTCIQDYDDFKAVMQVCCTPDNDVFSKP